jgi:hypothetical protein
LRFGYAIAKCATAVRLSRISDRVDAQRLHDGEATTNMTAVGN